MGELEKALLLEVVLPLGVSLVCGGLTGWLVGLKIGRLGFAIFAGIASAMMGAMATIAFYFFFPGIAIPLPSLPLVLGGPVLGGALLVNTLVCLVLLAAAKRK